jgi:dihydroorotate dehydrogenase electron transfer subunit
VDPPQGVIEVLYEAMGPKSRALASVAPGVHLDCLGPLGCGFDPPEGSRILLVGGGIGVPPLLFLGGQRRLRGSEVLLLVGARKAAKLLPDELLNRAADQVRVATDDGSRGHSGLVTDLLEQELEVSPYSVVCTCGPHPMMAKVSAICEESQVACQASLEEYMACGFGVCVGCVVEVKAGSGAALSDYGKYSRVCIDGPVFDARRVCWERPW